MVGLKGANLALRFLLELCLLAALGYWGIHVGSGPLLKIILGIGSPVLMAVVWGTFISPKAKVRLSRPLHLGAEMVSCTLGVAALFATGQPRLSLAFGVAAVLNRLLIIAWQQESISHGRSASVAGH